jgi:hypothetical protein
MKQKLADGGESYFRKTRAHPGLHGVPAIPLRRKAAKDEFYAVNAQQ